MCVNETGKTKVLIAMQNGQFKDSVMATVKYALENDSYCVKVIPLGDLGDEVMENYAACIVVNTCHGGKIGGKASKFIQKLSEREKGRTLLFTTTGGEGAKVKESGVDAVTAASRLKNAPSVADTIVAKTRAILQKRR
jgi:menaquinone-dependent protoporphyrinogen IX oxidase